jgi:hypothetical protein
MSRYELLDRVQQLFARAARKVERHRNIDEAERYAREVADLIAEYKKHPHPEDR